MSTTHEHKKIVDFVDGFKAANKNTVERVRKFDPKLRSWTYEVVKRDENAFNFVKKHAKSEAQHRRDEKKENGKNTIITRRSMSAEAERKMPKKPRSEMRQNVVRLRNEGKCFKEIGAMYKVSENSARTAYHRETHGK